MNTKLLVASLLAACAANSSDSTVTGGGGGKADGIDSFAPKFCGVNILESGPLFVAEVCFGAANASSTSEGFAAIRVSYSDDKVELYTVEDAEEVDRETRTAWVSRNDGEEHELTLKVMPDNPLVPVSIRGQVDRGVSFDAPLAAWTAIPKVTCFMNRRASIPGGEKRVQATIAMGPANDAYDDSASIMAYEGEYAFDITQDGPKKVAVLFKEYAHIEDEIDTQSCSLEGIASNTSFCKVPITIDANLGKTDAAGDPLPENKVHAFNFWCRLH